MELLSERGVAVFLPLSDANGEWRTENKKAVLAGKPFVPYLITKEILYYRDFLLEQLIQQEEQLEQQPMLFENASGQSAGRIHCVALRSSESQEGILLHYHKEGWQYACLPVITAQEAALERFCAAQLQQIAQTAESVQCHLELKGGRWKLSELLYVLSQALNQ